MSSRLRQFIAGGQTPGTMANWARKRRWTQLVEQFPDLADMRVLDLGGLASTWEQAPVRAAQVVLLNLEDRGEARSPGIEILYGDACTPPARLNGEHFDLVFSNSVIEHVGGHTRRMAFAESVHRFGDHHWVQTPYLYFPLEPHWVFPAMQFLPLSLRARISAHWPLGWAHELVHKDLATHIELVSYVELLSRTAMRYYFPHSDLLSERVLGITKSIIATA